MEIMCSELFFRQVVHNENQPEMALYFFPLPKRVIN